MDVLQRIKRLVLSGRVRYTWKARDEMVRDSLRDEQVIESLLSAQFIAKTLRSRSRSRRTAGEKLYVIKSVAYDGTFIYTKGTIRRHKGAAVFYVLVSAKIPTFED